MKFSVLLSAVVLLAAPVAGIADENLASSVSGGHQKLDVSYWMGAGDSPENYTSIIIKFHEDYDVRMDSAGLVSKASSLPGKSSNSSVTSSLRSVSDIIANSGLSVSPLFDVSETELASLKHQGASASASYEASRDMASYVVAEIPSWYTGDQIREFLVSVNQSPLVDVAYAEPVAEPAFVETNAEPTISLSSSSTPDYSNRQYYFDAAPRGIDVDYTHTLPGGRGQNVSIIDVEQSWNPDHETMPTFTWQDPDISSSKSSIDHGTAVLGIVAAQGIGIDGAVPYARVGYEAHGGGSGSVAASIAKAADLVGPGGVVLIEVHSRLSRNDASCTCNKSQCQFIAVEYWRASFDAIKKATAEGVIVVEAAGNGSMNLDDPFYNGHFDRNLRDSGAIMVGASDSSRREPTCWTNYGSRVDVHSWGENVVTAGYGDLFGSGSDNREYTSRFSGTSSASAIIAAGTASLQSVFASNRSPLGSNEMRFLLSSTGTAQRYYRNKNIGPQPNLRSAHSGQSKVPSGAILEPTTIVSSPNGGHFLAMQGDGNFVLYAGQPSGGVRAVWNSQTYSPGGWAELKSDGNLVVYTAAGAVHWQSGTSGNSGAELRVLDSGRIALYRSNRQIWASN